MNAKAGKTISKGTRNAPQPGKVANGKRVLQEVVLSRADQWAAWLDRNGQGRTLIEWCEFFLAGNTQEMEPTQSLRLKMNEIGMSSTGWVLPAEFESYFEKVHRAKSKRNELKWLLLWIETDAAKQIYPSLRTKAWLRADIAKYVFEQANKIRKGQIDDTLRSLVEHSRVDISETEKSVSFLANMYNGRAGHFAGLTILLIVQLLYSIKILPHNGDSEPVAAEDLIPLHEGILSFLVIKPDETERLRKNYEGVYFAYRPSRHVPGSIVKALVSFTGDVGQPFMVREKQVYQGSACGGDAPFAELWVGVMARKGNVPFMFTCRSAPSEETEGQFESRGAPRFTLLHNTIWDHSGKAVSMTGITVSPFIGSHSLAIPICLERIVSSNLTKRLVEQFASASHAYWKPSDKPLIDSASVDRESNAMVRNDGRKTFRREFAWDFPLYLR
jgi:hypothetical protein